VSRLPGDSFAYSFHIGMFLSHRRLGSKRATIEIGEKSRIGDGFRSELGTLILSSDARLRPYPPMITLK